MNTGISSHSASTPLKNALAALAVTALVACGGGGGGSSSNNDSDETKLSEKEKAALAARLAPSKAGQASDESEDSTYEGDSRAATSKSAITTRAIDSGAEVLDCSTLDNGSGAIDVYDDLDSPTTDIHYAYGGGTGIRAVAGAGDLGTILTEDSGVFTGSLGSATGTFENVQQRADCEGEINGDTFIIKGSFDAVQFEGIDDGDPENRALYAVAGQLDDGSMDPVDPPDLSGSLEQLSQGINNSSRYEIRSCEGCKGGDLENFTGDPRNSAVSAYTVMGLPIGDGVETLELGKSPADPFSLIFSHDETSSDPELTNMEINGRIASSDPDNLSCGFDVTYDTQVDLVFHDYDPSVGGETPIQEGRINITFDDSGNTYEVEFIDGDVYVDGELIDTSNLENACGLPSDESGGDEAGDASDLANNSWQSSCVQTGAGEWQQQTFNFINDTDVSFAAELHDNDTCTSQLDAASSQLTYETRESGTEGEFEIDFTLVSNSAGDTPGTVTYDLFAIAGGDTLYLGTEDANPPTSESSRPTSVDTTSEWAFAKQ